MCSAFLTVLNFILALVKRYLGKDPNLPNASASGGVAFAVIGDDDSCFDS
jgi:hypothetical protein